MSVELRLEEVSFVNAAALSVALTPPGGAKAPRESCRQMNACSYTSQAARAQKGWRGFTQVEREGDTLKEAQKHLLHVCNMTALHRVY